MYTEKQIKAKAKEFYTFCNKYLNKSQIAKVEVYPGITATVKYDIYVGGECIDITTIDLKLSKEMKALETALKIEFNHSIHNVDLDAKIDISDLVDEYNNLFNDLNHMMYGEDIKEYDNYLQNDTYDGLEYFYECVLEVINDQKKQAKEVRLKLTDEYFAIINKPHGRIHVGCQRIPIEKVRELVKLYDEA